METFRLNSQILEDVKAVTLSPETKSKVITFLTDSLQKDFPSTQSIIDGLKTLTNGENIGAVSLLINQHACYIMTFNKIHEGTPCSCVNSEAVEDTTTIFARRGRHEEPVLDDFRTYHQEKRKPKPHERDSCKAVCDYREVSIDIVTSENEATLKADLAHALELKPTISHVFCKFRLRERAGKVCPSPVKDNPPYPGNPYHYSLYKSDSFDMSKIEIIEAVSMRS